MKELPILLVTDGVLMPGVKMKIPVRTTTNLAMVENSLLNKSEPGHGMIVLGYRQDNLKKVFPIGTLAKINQIVCWSTNNSKIQYTLHLVGICRVEISNVSGSMCQFRRLYNVCNEQVTAKEEAEFVDSVKKLMMLIANEGHQSLRQLKDLVASVSLSKFDELTDICMSMIPTIPYSEQLEFLAELDVSKRMKVFNEHVKKFMKTKSLSMVDLNEDGSQKLNENLGIMVEKISKTKTIAPRPTSMIPKKSFSNSSDEILMKLESANLPEGIVKNTVIEEFERFKGLPSSAPEHPVLRSYLEFVADLPWALSTPDKLDMKEAKSILEADHEGMEDVKKRILEFFAVKKLKNEMKGPILCLAGPPGVGKTSVAKSIANALGRKYQRIALGGIRDQSDIRGHRRTYIGAMPGRILNALKVAKCNNPVILLDEVDKLGSGVQGDPAAALLEVLDPEQNSFFTDLYLNLPFDLRNVLFIATANDTKNIPNPLLDRMEIIEMSSYSNDEKILIAKNHIIPKQMTQHALSADYVVFEDDSIPTLIEYTYEAGVRQLERVIGAVCRNVALRVAESVNGGNVDADTISTDFKTPVNIDAAAVDEILKKKNKRKQQTNIVEIQKSNEAGIVFGLAWTPQGGEVLVIETVLSPGNGKTFLTGNLGNVIKESIQVALSVIRKHSTVYELDVSNLEKLDLHVHLPAGAVGKDGPSAGCAFTLALFSSISGKKVRKDSAVTGEVTLTGKVLPVGGIKEKLLAAYKNNIMRVILPKANEIDVQEISEKIRDSMQIEFVENVHELISKMIKEAPNVLQKPNTELLSKM